MPFSMVKSRMNTRQPMPLWNAWRPNEGLSKRSFSCRGKHFPLFLLHYSWLLSTLYDNNKISRSCLREIFHHNRSINLIRKRISLICGIGMNRITISINQLNHSKRTVEEVFVNITRGCLQVIRRSCSFAHLPKFQHGYIEFFTSC